MSIGVMSMIDPKYFAIAAPDESFMPVRNSLPVDRMLHDALVDVEEGVEFWKTLAGSRRRKRRASPEFLNRSG
jgi:hypothetical protein